MNKNMTALTITMLLSAHHGIQARYLNYDRIMQVTAKLKALDRNTAKVEKFEKNLKGSYINYWLYLTPGTYNTFAALMVELLETAGHKPASQKIAIMQVLEMIEKELEPLVKKYTHRKELIALSYKTTQLREAFSKELPINPIYAAQLKQELQDLLAEVLLTDRSFQSIEMHVKKYLQKVEEEQKKSQTESVSYEGTESKS
jgi:hypothetical protein